jgi:ketosteroid isomerase-like protein
MPQEDVEVVLRAHAAYSRGDLDAFLTAWHPEGVYRAAITQAVEGETADFTGHSGLRQWWDDLHDVYGDLETEVLEVHEAGERVVVVYVTRGRTRSSGFEGEERLAQVVTVRSGKIVEVRDYFTPREALEAVGLSD